jgi:hypothetical protein
MDFVNYKRPHRAIVRSKAKLQLLQSAEVDFQWSETDDALLNDLATTLFQSDQYQTLYSQCQSKPDMHKINRQLITELVETYRQLSERKQDGIIQRLNALLVR